MIKLKCVICDGEFDLMTSCLSPFLHVDLVIDNSLCVDCHKKYYEKIDAKLRKFSQKELEKARQQHQQEKENGN